MRNYPVLITEKLQITVRVKADNAVDAVAKAKERWGEGDIVLDTGHFTGVEISTIEDEKRTMLCRDRNGNECFESSSVHDELTEHCKRGTVI